MEIKLLIDGEDKNIKLVPENRSDKKLLEFVAEHDSARVKVNKGMYDREIESITLNLFTAPIEKGMSNPHHPLS